MFKRFAAVASLPLVGTLAYGASSTMYSVASSPTAQINPTDWILDPSASIDYVLYYSISIAAMSAWRGAALWLTVAQTISSVNTVILDAMTNLLLALVPIYGGIFGVAILLAFTMLGMSYITRSLIPSWQPVSASSLFTAFMTGWFFLTSVGIIIVALEEFRTGIYDEVSAMTTTAANDFLLPFSASTGANDNKFLSAGPVAPGLDGDPSNISTVDIMATYLGVRESSEIQSQTPPMALIEGYPLDNGAPCCLRYAFFTPNGSQFSSLSDIDRNQEIENATFAVSLLTGSYYIFPYLVAETLVSLVLTLAAMAVFLSFPIALLFAPFRGSNGMLNQYVMSYAGILKETILTAVFLGFGRSWLFTAVGYGSLVTRAVAVLAAILVIWRLISAFKLMTDSVGGIFGAFGNETKSAVSLGDGVRGAGGLIAGGGLIAAGVSMGNPGLIMAGAQNAGRVVSGGGRGGISPTAALMMTNAASRQGAMQGAGGGGTPNDRLARGGSSQTTGSPASDDTQPATSGEKPPAVEDPIPSGAGDKHTAEKESYENFVRRQYPEEAEQILSAPNRDSFIEDEISLDYPRRTPLPADRSSRERKSWRKIYGIPKEQRDRQQAELLEGEKGKAAQFTGRFAEASYEKATSSPGYDREEFARELRTAGRKMANKQLQESGYGEPMDEMEFAAVADAAINEERVVTQADYFKAVGRAKHNTMEYFYGNADDFNEAVAAELNARNPNDLNTGYFGKGLRTRQQLMAINGSPNLFRPDEKTGSSGFDRLVDDMLVKDRSLLEDQQALDRYVNQFAKEHEVDARSLEVTARELRKAATDRYGGEGRIATSLAYDTGDLETARKYWKHTNAEDTPDAPIDPQNAPLYTGDNLPQATSSNDRLSPPPTGGNDAPAPAPKQQVDVPPPTPDLSTLPKTINQGSATTTSKPQEKVADVPVDNLIDKLPTKPANAGIQKPTSAVQGETSASPAPASGAGQQQPTVRDQEPKATSSPPTSASGGNQTDRLKKDI